MMYIKKKKALKVTVKVMDGVSVCFISYKFIHFKKLNKIHHPCKVSHHMIWLDLHAFIMVNTFLTDRCDQMKSDLETGCDSKLKSCQVSRSLDFSYLTRWSEKSPWNRLRQSRPGVTYCVPLWKSSDSHLRNLCSCGHKCVGVLASLNFCWVEKIIK